MTNPEQAYRAKQNSSKETLNKALNRLAPEYQQHLKTKKGLSDNFQIQVSNLEESMEKCEKSMKRLLNEYLVELSNFQEGIDPLKALEALKNSEVIWDEETKVILEFRPNGDEKGFLNRMRENALTILENKALDSAKDRSRKNLTERLTLSRGILDTMGKIYSDLGYPEDSPLRHKLQRIAESFS
jgi:hypothetical protein